MSTEIDALCRQCDAKCCRYFCFEIDQPDSFEEYENIRWFMLHEGISIHIDEGKWFISIANKCRNLNDAQRCSEYESRPMICRRYSIDGCDATGGDYEYEELFTTAEQITAYARKKLGPRKYDSKWAKLCKTTVTEKDSLLPKIAESAKKLKKRDKKKDKKQEKKKGK